MAENTELRHLVGKALDAKRGGHDAWSVQSTGEKLAVAVAKKARNHMFESRGPPQAAASASSAEESANMSPEMAAIIRDLQKELKEQKELAKQLVMKITQGAGAQQPRFPSASPQSAKTGACRHIHRDADEDDQGGESR